MKDWKTIAPASGFQIPEADLDRIAPALDKLEETFRPLVASIPHDVEPAVIFRPTEDPE